MRQDRKIFRASKNTGPTFVTAGRAGCTLVGGEALPFPLAPLGEQSAALPRLEDNCREAAPQTDSLHGSGVAEQRILRLHSSLPSPPARLPTTRFACRLLACFVVRNSW
jgi:hypothetical protein